MSTTTTSPDTKLAPTRPAVDPALDRLLDAELGYDPVARSGFINHLAMSLVAARRLGATDAELGEWFDDQTSGTFLIPRDRPAWLDPDIAEIEARGVDAVVGERLPALIGAPGSQYFHAIIRLELAIDAGHAGQIANALRNWSDDARSLPRPPGDDGTRSFGEVLARLAAHPSASTVSGRSPRAIAAADWFAEIVDELIVDEDLLDEVSAAAIASHTDPHDFSSLHFVTGLRAVRAVAEHLGADDRLELARHAAHTVAAFHVSSGRGHLPDAGELDRRRATPVPSWARIARAAIDSGDPHVAKLVYACRLDAATTGDPLYHVTAALQTRTT